ncbi:DUF899 domain-containing protein [Pseudomonas sp. Leaf58]|uniref:DUF899 domain-containing protein n=1 Tax=Pseudomonas TaxID=286 RepID=UPI0006FAA993|nr:thioredoxin family protein [Pseudomonas sp. Leaf58]AYG45276.1 DUF899 domain-containing protein [Pseudomonas sp. Leaf58]KQN59176.1 thioredoxin [Pseudomonas sp. Leaf58]
MSTSESRHPVVSRSQWLAARQQLWLHEKAFTHHRDALAAARRALPWVKVERDYRFHGADGELSMADLFAGRSQLLVYHFMFAEGWSEGCPGCSFLADHFDAANLHLAHHDVSLVAVSRAPYDEFQAFRRRMGWQFPWYSSNGSGFNEDFGVSVASEGQRQYNYEPYDGSESELPGLSAFYREPDGSVYHTYSTYARGLDILVNTYNFLDIAPLGRNESGTMDWVRHHDRYAQQPDKPHCCHT